MIFLTGATGYVGRRIARRLVEAGHSVRCLVLPEESLPASLSGVDVVRGDILSPATLASCGDGVGAVVHSAAAMLPNSPETLRSVNVDGTRNLVAAARRWGAPRFVYMSAVSAAYETRNSYGQSKVDAEALVKESGLPWAILRPTMVYGDGGGLHFARLVELVRKAPGIFPVFGPGTARLQPVHVEDVAAAVAIALAHPSAVSGTWGVSGATVLTFDALVLAIARALGVRRRPVHIPLPLALAAARAVHRVVPDSFLSPEALLGLNQNADLPYAPFEEACGYHPRTLEAGLASGFGVSAAS